jgi:membrane associated rhomboid family serine protease
MFPIRDDNPHLLFPVVTCILIGLNVAAWLLLQGLGTEPALSRSVCQLGLIPGELLGTIDRMPTPGPLPCTVGGEPGWITLFSSMFMHGGWLHLIGNMWFLWIFGGNVEDAMGRVRFACFYLLCGLAAAGAQIVADAASPIPMVGASGAIGGVMGAYIVLYPRVHVHMLLFLGFYATTFAVPAVAMLGYWILLQLLGGFTSLGATGGGVAFWAHVGGFAAGALLVFPFRDERLLAKHPYHGWKQRGHSTEAWHRVRGGRGRWQ